MKRFIFAAIIATLATAAVSCDLTLLPEDESIPENYFRTENDLVLWSNQFYYDNLESAGYGSTADDMISNGLSGYVTASRSAATQSWSFTPLRNINYLLEHIDNCPDKGAVTTYTALARFFRGYFYFLRVRTYGDIPWYDHVLGSADPDVYKARDDRGYVMDKVLADFEYAAANLPASWTGDPYNSKVTKWAALAFASRAALYEGTFRKYHGMADADKYLLACVDFAGRFIDNAPLQLYNTGAEPYRDLFWSDNARTQEVVLCRHYDAAYGIKHSLGYNINFSRISLTKAFMNHYLMKDGTRFSSQAGWETKTFIQETKNRDPRMAQTVLCPGYKQIGETAETINTLTSHTGYYPIKYIGTKATASTSGGGVSDYPLMRVAEVYLNYAEAKAELGTIKQKDLDDTVNKLRKRAGITGDLNLVAANATPDPFLAGYYTGVTGPFKGVILEIRRERTVELVMEGQRSWDLFRWKECKKALNYHNPYYGCYFPGAGQYDMGGDAGYDLELYTTAPTSSCPTKLKIGTDIILSSGNSGYIVAYSDVIHGNNWNDARDYLWPVPAAQRILNNNLTQNPGWEDGLSF